MSKPFWSERALFVLGWVGIAAGILAVLVAFFIIGPSMGAASADLSRNLKSASQAVDALEKNAPLIDGADRAIRSGTEMARGLPQVLTILRGTLLEASSGLASSASALKKTKEGVAGLVLPGKDVGKGAGRFAKTAEQMRLLAGMIGEMQRNSDGLARGLGGLSTGLNQFGVGRTLRQILPAVRSSIAMAQMELGGSSSRWGYLLAGALVGSIYFFLGVMALALGISLRNSRRQLERQAAQVADVLGYRSAA